MKSRKLSIAAFVFAAVFTFNTATSVRAVELLSNGGFETGVNTPWVLQYSGCTDNGTSYFPMGVVATSSPGFGGTTNPLFGTRFMRVPWTCGPTLASGVYYPANTGFMLVYQDVTVPAGNSLTLQFSERLYTELGFFGAGDWRSQRPQNYRVQIRNTSNVVLQNVFTVTAPAIATTNIPWTSHTFNLGATYAGQTIRLAFLFTTETGLTGPGNCGIDGVSLDATAPTAADGSVTGRASLPSGRGISRASLRITDSQTGEVKTATTNPFGYYRFTELETGHFYILTVSSKRYTFQPDTQSFQVNDNLDGINFVGSLPD